MTGLSVSAFSPISSLDTEANAVKIIQDIYETLSSQADLSPHNPLVDAQFALLRKTTFTQADLSCHPLLQAAKSELPKLYSRGECLREIYKVKNLLKQPKSSLDILEPYFAATDYQELWSTEVTLLPKRTTHLTFLGSGALPFTAIVAALNNPSLHITCVDCDVQACDLSRQLIAKIGLETRIDVVCSLAQTMHYAPDDIVLCASLIEGKEAFYGHLFNQGVKQFLVRHVAGSQQFLYAPAPAPQSHHYQLSCETEKPEGCLHTTRLYTRV